MKRINVTNSIILSCVVWCSDGGWATANQNRALCNYHSLLAQQAAPTETPGQWVELGRRVHGGFGSYIALGIRIGQDAMERLEAMPRTLDITYYSGTIAPCPCVVDGIMIATVSTPGQNLLRVAATPSPAETFGVAEIRDRRTGKTLRYVIPATAKTLLDSWNRDTTGQQRYDAVMNASEEALFSVEIIR